MAKVNKKDNSSKTVILIVILVFVGAALFALGIFLGTFLSGKKVLLEGAIQLGNDNSIFTFEDLEMKAELTPDQEQMEGDEAVAYFGFSLDSAYGDNDGRLRWDGKHSEKLTVLVKGSITHAEMLKQIEYRVNMPTGVIQAARQGYIDISEFYRTEDGKYLEDEQGNFIPKTMTLPANEEDFVKAEKEEDGMIWSFEFELKMYWGSYFEGMNPSRFYDETEAGLRADEKEIEETLNDMRNIILNGENEARYTVYLNATPKESIEQK